MYLERTFSSMENCGELHVLFAKKKRVESFSERFVRAQGLMALD